MLNSINPNVPNLNLHSKNVKKQNNMSFKANITNESFKLLYKEAEASIASTCLVKSHLMTVLKRLEELFPREILELKKIKSPNGYRIECINKYKPEIKYFSNERSEKFSNVYDDLKRFVCNDLKDNKDIYPYPLEEFKKALWENRNTTYDDLSSMTREC